MAVYKTWCELYVPIGISRVDDKTQCERQMWSETVPISVEEYGENCALRIIMLGRSCENNSIRCEKLP